MNARAYSLRSFFVRATLVALTCLPVFGGFASAQTMSTFLGLNTVQYRMNSTATPDPTIAVGQIEYCEHVNSAYQCWYKSGANANQPVDFFGNTSPKIDSQPWSQNSNNNGNTPHCPTAYSPNSQMLHDNVYNVWLLEKRITATQNGHNYMCVAISNIEDFSQSNFSWFAFEYDLDTVIPTNPEGNYYYPDYPQSGLWQSSTSTVPPYTAATDQAMWITYDLQDINNQDNINGVLVCAVDLAGLRASTSNPWVNNSKTPACVVAHPLTAYNTRRSWVPANNSDTTPPIDADGEMFTYMIEPVKNGTSYLTLPASTQGMEQWTIDWTATTPTPTFVNSWDQPSTQPNGDQLGCFIPANYYDTVCVPQPSTASTGIYIDSVADRMQQFFHYTSNGGTYSTWTSAHAIQITPALNKTSQTEADIRILQRNPGAQNAVFVTADYTMLDPVDSLAYVTLPSIVRDKAGNLQGILGISGSGTDEHPGLDSVNFNPGMGEATTYGYIASPVTDGDAEDTDSLNYRWGDWYGGVLDPSDSCTVWVVGEYLPENRVTEPWWYTQLAKLPAASTCAGGPVLLSSVSLNFGSESTGVKSSALPITITNNQTTTLTIDGISAGGGVFGQTNTCQAPLAPGGTCTVDVYFTPTTTGVTRGTLTITDSATNSPQSIALAGIGATGTTSVSVTPSSLAFGTIIVNTQSTTQPVTVTNNGSTSETISSVATSGEFSETDNCTGVALSAGQSCTITAGFTPNVIGNLTGTITINDAAGGPQIVTLTGTSELAVTMSANLTFPAQDVGTTSPAATMTLNNNQAVPLTFTYATSGDYAAVGNGANPCNGTLAAHTKCTFSVTFTPSYDGVIKGALTITHNAAGSPASGGLSGTGQNGGTGPLTFTPASLNFGNVVINTSSAKSVTVKNTGSASVNITNITGSGYITIKASGTTPCGGTLAGGATCTFTATYAPLQLGTNIGGVTVIDNSSVSPQVINASGVGILPVTMSPTTLSFGTVSVGSTSAIQVVTVTNNETTAIPINSVVASGDFVYTTGGGVPCGTSIPANSICTLGVEFSPTVSAAITGDLTLSYAAGSSPQVVTLSGTGN